MSLAFAPFQKPIVEAVRATAVDLMAMPIEEARARFEKNQEPWFAEMHELASIRDLSVPGAERELRARLYRPNAEGVLPVILYAHGGGWTFGSIDSHHCLMLSLAAHSGCAVLGFDYRLAPEFPFPAPLDDVLAVLHHVEAGGLGEGYDAGRLALAGDSAGANLALGALLTLKRAGKPLPVTAALFYGCYGPEFTTASHARTGDGSYLLSTASMRWYWSNFLGGSLDNPDAVAAPLIADDLAGLPPLYLNAAGLDPLLDDTLIMTARLAEAGVRYRFDLWPGVVHGFLRFVRDLPATEAALAAAGDYLAQEFRRV